MESSKSMPRVALYARYSSDLQRETSIEDQFRLCIEYAEREGWKIVKNYSDRAISGATMVLRPGIQAVLQDARRGLFEVVLAEALDRVSRDQADVATLFKHLKFAGVTIFTLAEKEITELHVGLKGTMNALFLKDLADRVRRGQRGRIEHGKEIGIASYGYRVVKPIDAHGELIRGEREIVPDDAKIVRRIFREYAAGLSPQAIARRLNAEGIPGPRGRRWTNDTIRGNPKVAAGILNNELYIGRRVWNRERMVKDPTTEKRVSRLNPPEKWITVEVPKLRIVDDELWRAVKARQYAVQTEYANAIEGVRHHHQANRLNATHRPKSLLSGLVFCGCCGGRCTLRHGRFACRAQLKGSCSNSRSIRPNDLEEPVLAALREKMMRPDAVAHAMRAYEEERKRSNRERHVRSEADRSQLTKVERSMNEIVSAIEEGGYTRMLTDRLRELEAKQEALRERLAHAPEQLPDIPANVAEIYRRELDCLSDALNRSDARHEAAEAIRSLIERVTLTPGPKRGQVYATLQSELGTIVYWSTRGHKNAGAVSVVAAMCMWTAP
jgi:DNA invertase Pin-like site-specific DNA recombinase